MIKPLNNNVVLKKEKIEKKTESGIILSQKQEEEEYAHVIAVGKGKTDSTGKIIPIEVKVGDKVLYKTYSPTKIKYDNEEYMIISADDILAIIE